MYTFLSHRPRSFLSFWLPFSISTSLYPFLFLFLYIFLFLFLHPLPLSALTVRTSSSHFLHYSVLNFLHLRLISTPFSLKFFTPPPHFHNPFLSHFLYHLVSNFLNLCSMVCLLYRQLIFVEHLCTLLYNQIFLKYFYIFVFFAAWHCYFSKQRDWDSIPDVTHSPALQAVSL